MNYHPHPSSQQTQARGGAELQTHLLCGYSGPGQAEERLVAGPPRPQEGMLGMG